MRLLKKILPGYAIDVPFFRQPKLPIYVAVIALILTLPTLFQGRQVDDYVHRGLFPNVIDGSTMSDYPLYEKMGHLSGMYTWFDGNAERNRAAAEAGLPWWLQSNAKAMFLRPVSDLSLRLDYTLWPDTPMLMNFQNMLWYAVIAGVVVVLFRGVMGSGTLAGLAAFLYAISRTHSDTLSMIAGRNALLATFFAVLVLIVFNRVQKDGWGVGKILGPILLLLALLSAESALVVTAYLFSYAIFLGPKSVGQKIISLIPYAIVSLLWLIIYKVTGYGSFGSGGYIDPFSNPAGFLSEFVSRFPAMITSQFYALIPVGFGLNTLGSAATDNFFNLLLMVIMILIVIPFLKKDAVTRFWALGFVLSVIPMCVSMPSERYLMLAGIGAYGILAQIFGTMFSKSDRSQMKFLKKALFMPVAVVLFVLHFILSPLLLLATTSSMNEFYDNTLVTPAISMPTDDQFTNQSVVLINPPAAMFANYMFFIRMNNGLPLPARAWVLESGTGDINLTRTSENSIELDHAGGFLAKGFDDFYRDFNEYPLEVGETVKLNGMKATVLSLNENQRPQKVSFTFDKPLEEKSMKFLAWDKYKTYDFTLPSIGETKLLPKQEIQPEAKK